MAWTTEEWRLVSLVKEGWGQLGAEEQANSGSPQFSRTHLRGRAKKDCRGEARADILPAHLPQGRQFT